MAENSNEPVYIFVYGQLKSDQPCATMMKDNSRGIAVCIGQGETTEKFPLLVATQWNIPFLLHSPGKGHQIQGEIYKINLDILKELDKFELYPELYIRNKHQVTLRHPSDSQHIDCNPDDVFDCWIYQLKSFPEEAVEKCELLKKFDAWEQNGMTSLEEAESLRETHGHILTSNFIYEALLKAIGSTINN